MNKSLALALTLTLGGSLMTQAAATDLRIYPSFTEVREPVQATGNTLGVSLPQQAWEGVLQGSLDLEGLPFNSAVQRLEANWLMGLEGKTVYLKREEGKPTEAVTLVRARDLLVKDASGKFFTVRYEQLQFDVLPPANPLSPSRTLVFNLKAPGSGTLSYLTRSVTWQPRYTLKASDGGAQLTALADIRNSTDLPYDIKNTELYAGDVNIEGGSYPDSPMMMRAEVASGDASYAPAAKIQGGGEMRGLYKYSLSTAFTLPANSVVTLPFLTPKLTTFERYVGLNTYFVTSKQEGTLSRFYRFKADDRLPAGPVTVREDGRIVGQTNIGETRKGGEVEFSLGADPDVAYTRTVQTLSQIKDAKGNVTKTTYKVTYAFESSKTRAVRAEVTERVGGRRVTIDNAAPVQNQAVASLKVDVPANGKASKSLTVVVDNS